MNSKRIHHYVVTRRVVMVTSYDQNLPTISIVMAEYGSM
jgi:hypothetical protein